MFSGMWQYFELAPTLHCIGKTFQARLHLAVHQFGSGGSFQSCCILACTCGQCISNANMPTGSSDFLFPSELRWTRHHCFELICGPDKEQKHLRALDLQNENKPVAKSAGDFEV